MFEIYQNISDYITYDLFSLGKDMKLSKAINFFIYDTLKIFTLLVLIVFLISMVRSYFPLEKTRNVLSKNKKYAYPLAAFLGVLTPFCSCSAVPMFIGFVEAGIPLGAAFTFLVASPMVNEIALGLLISTFGIKLAFFYVGFGIIVSIFAGFIIDRINPRDLILDYVFEMKMGQTKEKSLTFKQRVEFALSNVKDILEKIYVYILIAIGIGGFIHGYVPEEMLQTITKSSQIWSVPLAVLIGVPLYSNSAGIIPVIQVLVEKGVPVGTALAFMMATTALSLPEFIILKQIMKIKLIVIFATIISVSIVVVGYLINFIM